MKRKPKNTLALARTITDPESATGAVDTQRGEQTAGQSTQGTAAIGSYAGASQLATAAPATYRVYREMRKDPTIALARALVMAPIVAAQWRYTVRDDAPEGAEEFITNLFEPVREDILQVSLEGTIDFGWAPFEKVFAIDRKGFTSLRKLKPLLQDLTSILVTVENCAFHGFKQTNAVKDVILPVEYTLNISMRGEGTNWYGYPLLENARRAWSRWLDADEGAARYDKRIAGSHWVVHYPVGTTMLNGVNTDNSQIADAVLAALQSSGNVKVPKTVSAMIREMNSTGAQKQWDVELLSDSTPRQPSFVDREKHLEALMVRALLSPERSMLEGTYGTKAEASTHADLALTIRELEHRKIVRLLNWHAVDQLLALNWGDDARGCVAIEAAPLIDEQARLLKDVYKAILSNPSGFVEAMALTNLESVLRSVGIPLIPESERTEAIDMPLDGMNGEDPNADVAREVFNDSAA